MKRVLSRALVVCLVFSLTLPLPIMAGTAPENGDSAHIHARLNGPERKAAIEEARRIHEAARSSFEEVEEKALPVQSQKKTAITRGQEPTGPLRGAGTAPLPVGGKASPEHPKTMSEALFNAVTGFMGLPGLGGTTPYDPNADQGLGFHQDGTARRADGTTGNSAGNFDGRRAASYLGNGLGYGPYGSYGANNPGGWYGAGYDPVTHHNFRLGDMDSRRSMQGYGMDMADPQQYLMQRGLNYGMGFLNSMGEAAFTGLTDKGRARLNFMVDMDGRINGEGDVLFPFYDGRYTTIFTQVGARSMSGMSDSGKDGRGADRWIGNFGLGQRWYPGAVVQEDGKTVDSGNWMVGYNIFFDNDFTRGHQRGGIGAEVQYDWLKLASNYYLPLSGWKGSYDYDSRFVKERAAQGWDLRIKGYLPFYRNLAVTGAYTQWQGDHVGMFSSRKLEKDPRVWSYGLEYTPVPLVSAFWNQRSTERGRSDAEFGLRFTWHFQMPWEDQIRHAKVAELRTVAASRHDFVDRENRIILEYKAKDNFTIEFLRRDGNAFIFRLKHALAGFAAGKTVRVSASGVMTLAEAKPVGFFAQAGEFLGNLFSVATAHAADLSRSYITDKNGEFQVIMTGLAASALVTVQAGNSSRTFTAAELGWVPDQDIVASIEYLGGFLASGGFTGADATLRFRALDASGKSLVGKTLAVQGAVAKNAVTDKDGILLVTSSTAYNTTFTVSSDGVQKNFGFFVFDALFLGKNLTIKLPPQLHGATILSTAVNANWGNVVLASQPAIVGEYLYISASGGWGPVDIETSNGVIRIDNFG